MTKYLKKFWECFTRISKKLEELLTVVILAWLGVALGNLLTGNIVGFLVWIVSALLAFWYWITLV